MAQDRLELETKMEKSQSGNFEVETPNFFQNFWRNWTQATESVTTVSNFKLLVIIHRVIGGNWAISPIFFQWLVADHFLAQPRPLHRVKIEALSTRTKTENLTKMAMGQNLGRPYSIYRWSTDVYSPKSGDGWFLTHPRLSEPIQTIQGTLWR